MRAPGTLRPDPAIFFRPAFNLAETALKQIERLGYQRSDVRHIIVTHFDADHIGGIADFPEARIHVTAAEVLGAMRSRGFRDRVRFRPVQREHGPKIVEHQVDGETRGADSQPQRNSPRSAPALRWCHCRGTPVDMPA